MPDKRNDSQPNGMNHAQYEDIELSLFVKAMFEVYGYDFSQYQTASLKRRVLRLVSSLNLSCISELLPKLFYQEDFLSLALTKLSVGVTELFRDPSSYASLIKHVFPILKTYPSCRVWDAGCSTGEEAFSLGILLEEFGLLQHGTIYATDLSQASIDTALSGVLKNPLTKKDVLNYQQSDGNASLADYFITRYSSSKLIRELLSKIDFEQHNLVHDTVFCEVHLVVCRNVLIYFNIDLQNKVLQLLSNSLIRGGFLMIGPKESLVGSPIASLFHEIDGPAKIYQKID